MNTPRFLTRTGAAIALTAATTTAAFAYDASTVSPADPFGGIAVNAADNGLAAVSHQLAALSSAEVSDLIERCDVINHNDENYDHATVVFCHRALVSEGVLTTDDTGVASANDADSNYEDNDADPVDDNDAV